MPEDLLGSGRSLFQERLELDKGVLDRVEVWRIGRQEQEACTGGGDRRPHRGALVGRQVVHDHDIAVAQRRAEDLLDVGQEPPPGHRTIQHHWCREAAQAQAGDKGGGLPVAVRDAGAQPLAAGAAPVQAGHLGRGAGLVEEHQLGRVKVRLRLEPRLPRRGDVRAVLLGRMRGFFYT